MEIWFELGIFGLVFVFGFWQLRDVRKAQELTRQQRVREKAALGVKDQESAAEQATDNRLQKS